jgi:DNA processing protein
MEKKEEYEVIDIMDSRYPPLLRQLDKKAPERLWCAGDVSLMNERCVAVVGSRKPSQYGKWTAFNAGRKLAHYGIVTVSGMAMGCDSEAHRGAVEEGGKTIAVLGCGIDICYPERSYALRSSIIKNGLIISEFPPGTPPRPANFPQRNRIISGLSEITVVAEAALSSGSLITAGYAAEQGREVMAAPGYITNPMSIGCNKLIQDGVTPLVCLDDIIRALKLNVSAKPSEISSELGKDERIIYETVKMNGEVSADFIASKTGKRIQEINSLVAILEIKGFVLTSMGKIYVAK